MTCFVKEDDELHVEFQALSSSDLVLSWNSGPSGNPAKALVPSGKLLNLENCLTISL